MKNRALVTFGKRSWGPRRTMPRVAPRTFKELWEDRQLNS
jgi:hypothetical protein